jgi:predicted RNA-binding Zn-ribbon protein involved in translation (DUF1610 family)
MPFVITCPGCNASLRLREEYAGKQIKCPRCSHVVSVPAQEPAAEAAPPLPPQAVQSAQRTAPPPLPPRGTPPPPAVASAIEEGLPAKRAAAAPGERTRPCPNCGERVSLTAEKCRYCKAWLDEDDEEDDRPRPRRKHTSYKPCPNCGATGATRVTWTPWGSFYGPALFTHVRCPDCGYCYNGRTGRSNLIWAIIFVTIPAVLIIAIIVGLLFMLGVFRGR